MCPSIVQSCCKKEDQEVMYLNWIQGKEEDTVNFRYEQNADVYQ